MSNGLNTAHTSHFDVWFITLNITTEIYKKNYTPKADIRVMIIHFIISISVWIERYIVYKHVGYVVGATQRWNTYYAFWPSLCIWAFICVRRRGRGWYQILLWTGHHYKSWNMYTTFSCCSKDEKKAKREKKKTRR